jgi:hypothetical protein
LPRRGGIVHHETAEIAHCGFAQFKPIPNGTTGKPNYINAQIRPALNSRVVAGFRNVADTTRGLQTAMSL